MNPLYGPNPGVIWPSVAPVSIELWRELYLGHNVAAPWDGLLRCVIEMKDKHQTLKRAATELHQQIKQVLEEVEIASNSDPLTAFKNSELASQGETIACKLTQLNLEQAQNT